MYRCIYFAVGVLLCMSSRVNDRIRGLLPVFGVVLFVNAVVMMLLLSLGSVLSGVSGLVVSVLGGLVFVGVVLVGVGSMVYVFVSL